MKDLTKASAIECNRVVLDELLLLGVNVLTAYPIASLDGEVQSVHYVGLSERRPKHALLTPSNRIFAFLRGNTSWRVLGYGLQSHEGPDSIDHSSGGDLIRRFRPNETLLLRQHSHLLEWSVGSFKGLEHFLSFLNQRYTVESMQETVMGYRRMGLLRHRSPMILPGSSKLF